MQKTEYLKLNKPDSTDFFSVDHQNQNMELIDAELEADKKEIENIKAESDKLNSDLSGKANSSHTHTKSEVGLGNVDNTADANKSVKYAASAGSAPANGGDSDTVNGHTVKSDVPDSAKFTDTWRGIQDNLTSESASDSLSANQGRKLNNKLTELDNSKLKGYTVIYTVPANTGGWHKIADITGDYFNFDLYATGGWAMQRKSNAHFQIQNVNGSVRIVQLSGISDPSGIGMIRMVRVVDDRNTWILEENSISSSSNEIFMFTIAGDVTVTPLDGSVDTTTDFKDSVSLNVSNIPTGAVITTSNIDNALSPKSVNPVQNKVVAAALNGKMPVYSYNGGTFDADDLTSPAIHLINSGGTNLPASCSGGVLLVDGSSQTTQYFFPLYNGDNRIHTRYKYHGTEWTDWEILGLSTSQSTAITTAGKYALDAVQNNASVSGTLANRIKAVEDTVGKVYSKTETVYGSGAWKMSGSLTVPAGTYIITRKGTNINGTGVSLGCGYNALSFVTTPADASTGIYTDIVTYTDRSNSIYIYYCAALNSTINLEIKAVRIK